MSPELGSLIDFHDAVYRFNHAPGGGKFAAIAGNATTYRLSYVPDPNLHGLEKISPQFIQSIDNSTLLLSVYYKKLATRILEYDLQKTAGVGVIPTELRKRGSECIYGSFHEHLKEGTKPTGPVPSQGIIGVLAALKACRRVAVFGRAYNLSKAVSTFSNSLPFHYYENRPANARLSFQKVHGKTEEDYFLENLADRGVLTVIPGCY